MDKIHIVDSSGFIIDFIGKDPEVVTPSDSIALKQSGQLFIGTGGNISIKAKGSETAVLFKNVANGSWFPVLVEYVMSTNTTATDIVLLK